MLLLGLGIAAAAFYALLSAPLASTVNTPAPRTHAVAVTAETSANEEIDAASRARLRELLRRDAARSGVGR